MNSFARNGYLATALLSASLPLGASTRLEAWSAPDVLKIYQSEQAVEEVNSWFFSARDGTPLGPLDPPLIHDYQPPKWETDPMYRRIVYHAAVHDATQASYLTAYSGDKLSVNDQIENQKLVLELVTDMHKATWGCAVNPTASCLRGHGVALINAGFGAATYHYFDRPDLQSRIRTEFDPSKHPRLQDALNNQQGKAEDLLNWLDMLDQDPEIQQHFRDPASQGLVESIANGEIQTGKFNPGAFGSPVKVVVDDQQIDFKERLATAAAEYYRATETVATYSGIALQVADLAGADLPQDLRTGVGLFIQSTSLAAALSSQQYAAAASTGISMISTLVGGTRVDPHQVRFEAIMKQLGVINYKLDTVLDNQKKILNSLQSISDQIAGTESRLARTIIHTQWLLRYAVASPYRDNLNVCVEVLETYEKHVIGNLQNASLMPLVEQFLAIGQRRQDLNVCWESLTALLRNARIGDSWHAQLSVGVGGGGTPGAPEDALADYARSWIYWPFIESYFSYGLDDEHYFDVLLSALRTPLTGEPLTNPPRASEESFTRALVYNQTGAAARTKLASLSKQPLRLEHTRQVVALLLGLQRLIALSDASGGQRVYKEYLNAQTPNQSQRELKTQRDRLDGSIVTHLRNARLHLAASRVQTAIWDGRALLGQASSHLAEGNTASLLRLAQVLMGCKNAGGCAAEFNAYPGHELLKRNLAIFLVRKALEGVPNGHTRYQFALGTNHLTWLREFVLPKLRPLLHSSASLELKCIPADEIQTISIDVCPSVESGRVGTGAQLHITFAQDSAGADAIKLRLPMPGWQRVTDGSYYLAADAHVLEALDAELASTLADYLTPSSFFEALHPTASDRSQAMAEYNRLLVLEEGGIPFGAELRSGVTTNGREDQ